MDTALNIVVRVAGRQAQQAVRQLNADLAKLQARFQGVGVGAGGVGGGMAAGASGMASSMGTATRSSQSFNTAMGTSAKSTNALTRSLHSARDSLSGRRGLGFAASLQQNSLVGMGKNMNWVGRQLTYNFTLPIALAGAGLFKFGQDVERSMVQVRKVYGTIEEQTNAPRMLAAELEALGKTFELLSTRFGVHQREVVDIGAAWAAAGSAGAGLAKNTRATMEAMILGDMDAATATEALIAIQDTWRFSTQEGADGVSELTTQLGYLNAIENTTAISFADLIEVTQRAGAVGLNSGLEFRELAAAAAALVPSTGSAAQAGTSLRSMMSSLMAPTDKAREALRLMGIEVNDPSFMGADVRGRLELVAERFTGLSDAQKGVVGTILATKWQVSRFNQLMNDIASGTGRYAQALNATDDAVQTNAQYQRELLTVLESSPRRWDIMVNAIRNSMSSAFLPMIPAIMTVLGVIARLAEAFSNLDPNTQKWIMMGLLALALIGPLMSLQGSFMQLFGVIGTGAKWAVRGLTFFAGAVLLILSQIVLVLGGFVAGWQAMWAAIGIGPVAAIAILAAVILAIIILMNDNLRAKAWEIIQSIGEAFSKLPGIMVDVFSAVIRVLAKAMTEVVKLLSYLNPFARHSPSLVDNVRAGVTTILNEYSRLRGLGPIIASAAAALQGVQPQLNSFKMVEQNEQATKVASGTPQNLGAFQSLSSKANSLRGVLPGLAVEISRQNVVVAAWTAALKQADDAIEAIQRRIDGMEKTLNALGDAISAAKDRISELASTPIAGMTALEDQIFANQLAQDKLNMELLQFQRAGKSIDSVREKYAAMAGEIELLRGTQAELRNAGAGSDILNVYDSRISAIEKQRGNLSQTEQQISDIEKQLEALDIEARFLALTKSINFDPLERQIDRMVNGVAEMSFEDIVAQIRQQQAIVATLQPQYDALAAAVEREKLALEGATATRDRIQDQLDAEQERASALQEAYSDIESLINDMESAMSAFGSSAQDALAALEALDAGKLDDLADSKLDDLTGKDLDAAKIKAEKIPKIPEPSALSSAFETAEGLDFEDTGGSAGALGREGGLPEIEDFNAQLEQEIADALAGMGDMDFTTPFKEAWQKLVDWWNQNGRAPFEKFVDWLKNTWPFLLAGALAIALLVFAGFPFLVAALIVAAGVAIGLAIMKWGPQIWDWTYENVLVPVGRVFRELGLSVGKWLNDWVIQPIWQALQVLGDVIGDGWDMAWSFLADGANMLVAVGRWVNDWIIQPVWQALQVLGDIIRGAWDMAWSILAGGMDMLIGSLQVSWAIVSTVVGGALGFIVDVIRGAWDMAWGILAGGMNMLIGSLGVSWAIVSTIVSTTFGFIVDLIRGAWDMVWGILAGGMNMLVGSMKVAWDIITAVFSAAWGVIQPILQAFWDFFQGYILPIIILLGTIVAIVVVAVVKLFQELGAAVKWVWDNLIYPALSAFVGFIMDVVITTFEWLFTRVDDLFRAIGNVIKWVWDNVVSPTFNFIKAMIETLVGTFEWLFTNIDDFFRKAGAAIKWVWDNVIVGTFNAIDTTIRETVVPAFKWVWDEGKRMFQLLGDALAGIYDKTIAPIWDLFMWGFKNVVRPAFEFLRDNVIKPIMDTIVWIIGHAWNGVASAIETGVNFFVSAFNIIAGAVNAIAGFLGLGSPVPTMNNISVKRAATSINWEAIPGFAKGGLVDPRGGRYNTPHAVVGEGSRGWPEYVIPTDPRYRANALALMEQAGTRLFAGGGVIFDGVEGAMLGGNSGGAWEFSSADMETWLKNHAVGQPLTGVGSGGGGGSSGAWGGGTGWFDAALTAIKEAGKWVSEQAMKAMWSVPKAAATTVLNQIPNDFIKNAGFGILDKVDAWVNAIHGGLSGAEGRSVIQGSFAPGAGDTGTGASAYVQGIPIVKGSGSWQAFVTLLNRMNIPYANLGTYVNKRTRFTNSVSWHALNRAMDFGGTTDQLRRIDHALYDAFKPHLHELIWTGTNSRNVYQGRDHTYRADIAGQHVGHVHASMANGGMIVPHVPGGVNLRVAEAGRDERIQVIPLHGGQGDGGDGDTFIFNGDLTFPNIKSGADAEELIKNLRALAS